jgi:hypothetical protein
MSDGGRPFEGFAENASFSVVRYEPSRGTVPPRTVMFKPGGISMERIFVILITLSLAGFATGASAKLNGKGVPETKCHAVTGSVDNVYQGTYKRNEYKGQPRELMCKGPTLSINCDNDRNTCDDGWTQPGNH